MATDATYDAVTNVVTEIAFAATGAHRDPFNELEVDALVDEPGGGRRRVPCFWAGGTQWKLRFAPSVPGRHRFTLEVIRGSDAALASSGGMIDAQAIVPYDGDNLLLRRGALEVAPNGRYLQHADGTPFLWLADDWWHAMSSRLRWPDEFKWLGQDRKAKGFNVIHFAAGFACDVTQFDPRDTNEAGHPWEPGYARINPAYFDLVDLKVQELVRMGLVPDILGLWGYHVNWLGPARMKQHWRYLIARYGGYPVVWTLCGEGNMPWYLADDKEQARQEQKATLNDTARYIKQIDPYQRLLTVHPGAIPDNGAWIFPVAGELEPIFDFFMIQQDHEEDDGIGPIVSSVKTARELHPDRPAMLGEALFEGMHGGTCNERTQRTMFWACMLSGAAGHCYGADGMWQFNRPDAPFGASPPGSTWGDTSWPEAAGFPGSKQVGLGKKLLERYPWWRFEPHPEWIFPAATDELWFRPYAAGIPGELRVFYFPRSTKVMRTWLKGVRGPVVRLLEPQVRYRACYLDPIAGGEFPVGDVTPTAEGEWLVPDTPILQDWVLVLETS